MQGYDLEGAEIRMAPTVGSGEGQTLRKPQLREGRILTKKQAHCTGALGKAAVAGRSLLVVKQGHIGSGAGLDTLELCPRLYSGVWTVLLD